MNSRHELSMIVEIREEIEKEMSRQLWYSFEKKIILGIIDRVVQGNEQKVKSVE